MKIDFANLKRQYELYKDEIDAAIASVIDKTSFIMGEDVVLLEKELSDFCKVKHAITCSSGTDALQLALMAIDIKPSDEVITTPFTFIATAEMIAHLGAKPVFVDIDSKTYNMDISKIESAITDKTKAIIPVSLYGQCADMDEINELAEKYKLVVIEDGAQSFGAKYKNKRSCSLSQIGCTSFFPAKPLGCFGDGGAVFTDDEQLATKIKSLRIHGQTQRYYHKYIGIGGRLDTIQAAVLRVKLKDYENEIKRRQSVASMYDSELKYKDIVLPFIKEDRTSVWAQYSICVKNRTALMEKLKAVGIPTAVHYPLPLHLQECFAYLGCRSGDFPVAESVSSEILSLPMNGFLCGDEIRYVADFI